jgi:hypothetical protein
MPRRKLKFPVNTRVVDIDTGARGVVVHVFRDPMLADTRVVRFGAANDGIAVPIESIRKYKLAPIAARRRGGRS